MSIAKSRLMLIALIALFVLPVLASFALFHLNWQPWGTSNKGELIVPIRALPKDELALQTSNSENTSRSTWTILMVVNADCDGPCTERLVEVRQIRKALNKDAHRIRRLLVSLTKPWPEATVEMLSDQFPGLEIGHASEAWTRALSADSEQPASGLYLIDPRGNLMMAYGATQSSTDVYDDLRRLLKSSRAG